MADEEKSRSQEAPADTTQEPADSKRAIRRKKSRQTVPAGQIHVLATFNNTIVTVTDPKGGTLVTSSAGSSGFRGSKKGTAYAAQVAAEKAISTAKQNHGLQKADIFVKGIGLGRDAAVKTAASQSVAVEAIYDVTGVPHGGVRPRKAKRN